MPGVDSRIDPPSAIESSASDEASQLEIHLQRQLEDDVARIFDESIYTDLEVVSGKLKILTHSCILRARTNKFYHILETILHVNIGRSTFEEIYSFISDTYTECDINHQEKEILNYLKRNPLSFNAKKGGDEPEKIFLPPKSHSPCLEKTLKKSISSSPSTELTKEYYALVPIEGNLLEKELLEQDVLSTAFQSIISSQSEENNLKTQRSKPTSLALISSHTPKSVKHSNSFDISTKSNLKDYLQTDIERNITEKKESVTTSQILKVSSTNDSNKLYDNLHKTLKSCNSGLEKIGDSTYSPDSLITDDPSSSSDYLSAAYTCSPGVSSACAPQFNVQVNIIKMENIFTSSDSGLENTGLLESLTSHKDVTLTDMSLTESTLHDELTDGSNSHNSSPLVEKMKSATLQHDSSQNGTNSQTSENSGKNKELNCNSTKEEKQRQNEEIVILESSSLSSETGSWESVFPPKLPPKKVCEKFLHNERQRIVENDAKPLMNKVSSEHLTNVNEELFRKTAFKSTSCFIDAASLVDEEEGLNEIAGIALVETIPVPSQPVPCSTNKIDMSPNDWSENDNEDSLEQMENKDPDSIQKDLSPTIFEMTPITEDSLCTNAFEQVQQFICEESIPEKSEDSTNTVHMSTTPHNSIMSLKVSSLKNYESEGNESDTTITGRDSSTIIQNFAKYNESSPIISGGASVEDHLPTVGSYSGSPQIRRRIENIPIVSGAYCYAPPEKEEKQNKSPRPACAPAWVVDMSSKGKPEVNRTENKQNVLKKPSDKVCDSLKKSSKNSNDLENCNKSRCSIDSDSSEKSSHKFYIDLSTLPNPTPPKNLNEVDPANEKKNMFSMYIDFGEKSTVKEIPQRLTSLSTKNNNTSDTKNSPKIKNTKVINEPVPVASAKNIDTNSTSIFEKYESLCDDPNISISEIIGFPDKNRKDIKGKPRKDLTSNKGNEFEGRNYYVERSLNPNYGATIHEECVIEQEVEPFVRLSDLDKPVQHVDPDMQKPNKPFGERMTRSIPDSNWCEQQNQSGNSRSNEIISSFHSENAQSLNRLFPHLRNEFSRSMPGSLSSRTRSPMRSEVSSNHGDIEDQTSDTSEMSSMHSSLSRLLDFGTPEESQASSLIGNCQSRLGQDLLRMFLEEIAPDVIVEVSGRRIKAHKCILSSRCQYFAGILSGGWVESAGNVIALPPFSFSVVHFALCHIYSGVSAIPDSISIVELATLADMLGLEGLKEAIMFTLKAKYCHHFHRPCAVCKAGVLECFPLCSVYGMDDLYRKCLKWIIKYLPWVIPTKAFATLPSELLEKCYQEIVINMTLDNVLNTVYSVGLTGVCIDAQEDLTRVRWGEVVLRLCRRVIHAAAHFIAPNLVTMFRSLKDVPADPPPTAKQSLDECMAAAIEWSPADECCRAYQFLFTVTRDMRNHRFAKPDLIKSYPDDNALYAGADSWLLQCEVALVRAAPRVCSTQAFIELPSELRRRLRELGCIMYGGQAQLLVPPPAPPQNRRSAPTVSQPKWQNSSTSRNSEIDRMRAAFIPYASKPVAVTVSTDGLKNSINFQDLKKLSRTIPPTVRTTKAQEERAKFNLSKTIPSQEKPTSKTVTQKPFENTKPRYLEPKTCSENLKKLATPKKYVPKISSSESSRNSSPVQARNLRTSRMKSRPITESNAQALSQDSLVTSSRPRTAEPSTDSLSGSQTSNKYATYTKTKKSNAVKCTKNTTAPNPPAKVKTKIPVYLNSTKLHNTDAKSNGTTRTSTTTTTNSSASLPLRTKVLEKNSCSLMNATKSSSAKMVTKVVTKPAPARTKAAPKGKTTKRTQRHGENDPPTDIPVMERSGTFLKDEPTFGAKTTNIDQDQ